MEKAFEAIFDKSDEYEGTDERQIGFHDLLTMGCGSAAYVYDYGDYWQHTIQLEERVLSDQPRVLSCLAGERACPPEDVGGTSGYERMLKVLADPTDDEYESFIEWLPENYDPRGVLSRVCQRMDPRHVELPGLMTSSLATFLLVVLFGVLCLPKQGRMVFQFFRPLSVEWQNKFGAVFPSLESVHVFALAIV